MSTTGCMTAKTAGEERHRRNRRRARRTVFAAGVVGIAALGAVFAYLTGTSSAVNRFTVADSTDYQSKISVIEAKWDLTDENGNGVPDKAEGMLPGQTIDKDPKIVNGSSIDSWAVMSVAVPTASVQMEGEDSASLHELFTYTLNSGWTEQGTGSYDPQAKTTTHIYIADDMMAANSSTATVFDSVTFANVKSGQLSGDDLDQQIDVVGYAIQALGFDNGADAWSACSNQSA